MKRSPDCRHLLKSVGLAAVLFVLPGDTAAASPTPQTSRPNVILCMADDQGYGDVGYNGHPVLKTPNLDAISQSGIRFDRFYSAAPVCSPTRGSALTGRHPFRYGIYFANVSQMKKEEVTLAEALRTVGYSTGHFGKWHLGTLTTKIKDANRGKPGGLTHYSPPWRNGFDACFSTESKVPTWDPMLVRTNQGTKKWWNPIQTGEETKSCGTHYWTGEETMVDPGELRGCDSKLIMDHALAFIDRAVERDQPFFTVIWFHAPHWPVVAGDTYRKMYADQSEFAKNHFGCLTAMDEQIGRLRTQLRRLGVAENTMLWYCSDNGPEGRAQGENGGIGSAGSLRGRKRSLYEGGVRVPGLLEWPAKIRKRRVVTIPCSTSDYFPTVLDALDFQMEGQPQPIDGISLMPLIEGKMTERPKPIGFQSGKQISLTDNRYKLYSKNKGDTWELYDLVDDPSESNNLATTKPDTVKRMAQTLNDWIASCTGQPTPPEASYAVVVRKSTSEDAEWRKVVVALKKKYDASIITYDTSVDESLDALKQQFPRYTCFVARPEDAGRKFVAQVHQLTRKFDHDPYTDTFWGILTGYNADNALAIADHSRPLVVKKVASGTEFATEMVTEGEWYDELVKNKHVKKDRGGKAEELKGPDDTTNALVDLLNDYQPDLMITSGHATEREWNIGFRFRSGQFRCADGRLYGLDTQKAKHPIHSPNPKVYMPIGNCLMGHVKDRDAMALAWMNSAGVKQMLGYTIPTGYGYGGWGCLDYFVEQPGRYTFTEAFLANHHALIHRMNDPTTDTRDKQRLQGDRDVVAFFGDPKWSAKMAEMPKYYDQKLDINDGVYTLTITPNRIEDSFKPVNTNGSERGGRPIIQFLPHRIQNIKIVIGEDLNPVVTDDFILVPNPRECGPDRKYVVRFLAKELVLGANVEHAASVSRR